MASPHQVRAQYLALFLAVNLVTPAYASMRPDYESSEQSLEPAQCRQNENVEKVPQLRSWTVKDSVELTYFSGHHEQTNAWPRSPDIMRFVVNSPDEKKAFIIRHRGDIEKDSNFYTLSVFSLEKIGQAIAQKTDTKPLAEVSFSTASSVVPAIRSATWDKTSENVVFLVNNSRENSEVNMLNISSGVTTRLTDVDENVEAYALHAGTLIYDTIETRPAPAKNLYPMYSVTRLQNGLVELPQRKLENIFRSHIRRANIKVALPATRLLSSPTEKMRVAPGGGHAILISSREEAPITLIDMAKGVMTPLLVTKRPRSDDGPNDVVWIDEKHAVFVFEKGSVADSAPEVLLYNVETGQLKPSRLQRIQGLADRSHEIAKAETTEFKIQTKIEDLPSAMISFKDRQWNLIGSSPRQTSDVQPKGIVLEVVQNANLPARLQARSADGEIVLIDLGNEIAGIDWAKIHDVSWPEPSGEAKGGLMLPPHQCGPLPLIIQIYTYHRDFFLPDGHAPSGSAAQALAAQGFAVLQLDLTALGMTGKVSKTEGPDIVTRIDAAVSKLARDGVIDEMRVGIVGFSRGGYEVYYALTHPGRIKLAAAAVVDSFTGDYSSYLRSAPFTRPGGLESFEAMAGGSFWNSRADWLKHETSFNVDMIDAPVVFFAHGSGGFDESRATLGAFRLNNKPLEYFYLPTGDHQLLRPREREAQMQAIVDWFSFWILNKAPTDTERAERWRGLSLVAPVSK